MNDDYEDITPDTHFLESIRADSGAYWSLFAEAVDNSFDADAHLVVLELTPTRIGIRDDGRGVTRKCETALFRLGEHRAHITTNLGRFGIGLKYHAVSAGEVLQVKSRSTDGLLTIRCDWRDVIKSGRWQIPKAQWLPVAGQSSTGTAITITDLRWRAPAAKDIDLTRTKLAHLFYPAIADGRRILLNNVVVPLLAEPEMRDVVEDTVRLPNGKSAHVRGGMLVNAKNPPLHQVQVSYKHRVIMPNSPFGCGEYSGLRQMFARVDLNGPWELTRFKDDLVDHPDVETLRERVQDILHPILEQCKNTQMNMSLRELTTLINDLVPAEYKPARPERSGQTITRKTRKRGPQHRPTKGQESKTGPAQKPQARGLVISFEDGLCEEYGFGHFQPGRPCRIVLAKDNPDIQALLNVRDKTIAAHSLYAIASLIFCHEQSQQPSQFRLNFDSESIGQQAWQMVAQQTVSTDDQSVA